MVIHTDIIGILQIFFIVDRIEDCQDLSTFFRVGLHNFKFFFGEFPRLIQNNVRNSNLPHIMKRSSTGDHANFLFVQAIFRIAVHDVLQQHFGKCPNAEDMLPGFHTSVLNYGRKCIHQYVCGFLQAGRLFLHRPFQMLPVLAQFHGVMYPAADHMGFKGFGHNINSTQIKSPHFIIRRIPAGNHDYRELVRQLCLLHALQYFIAVFHRHDNIQQNRGYGVLILLYQIKRLFAIFGFQNIIFSLKDIPKKHPVKLHIIYN